MWFVCVCGLLGDIGLVSVLPAYVFSGLRTGRRLSRWVTLRTCSRYTSRVVSAYLCPVRRGSSLPGADGA